MRENVFSKMVSKQCPDFIIHVHHEWSYTNTSEGIIDQSCWCDGVKVVKQATLYELIVSIPDNPQATERKLLTLGGAAAVYDNGWIHVSFGDIVYEDGDTRPMTEEDQRKIADAADEYSASK